MRDRSETDTHITVEYHPREKLIVKRSMDYSEVIKDWRYTGQDNYLTQKEWIYSKWFSMNKSNDHDHCEFCMGKFCLNIHCDFDSGWHDEDGYSWICSNCFHDFSEAFQLKTT